MPMAVNLATFLPVPPLSSSSSAAPRLHINSFYCQRRCLLRIPINSVSSIKCSVASPEPVTAEEEEFLLPLQVAEINDKCKKWVWNGHTINYLVYPECRNETAAMNPPLLLVHGFGASIAHWRRYAFLHLFFIL